jgi:hypothetical protein
MTFKRTNPQWCLMATIQVDADAPDLARILADLDFDFKLLPTCSPPGVRWLHLYVDARRGPRRCALTAHRLLCALSSIAATGELPSFRILAGERWLESPGGEESHIPKAEIESERETGLAA